MARRLSAPQLGFSSPAACSPIGNTYEKRKQVYNISLPWAISISSISGLTFSHSNANLSSFCFHDYMYIVLRLCGIHFNGM